MVIPSTGCCSFLYQKVEGGVHYDLFDKNVKLKGYPVMQYFLACFVMGLKKAM